MDPSDALQNSTFLHILLKLTINVQMHDCELAERKPS